jgi:hypothetical protein
LTPVAIGISGIIDMLDLHFSFGHFVIGSQLGIESDQQENGFEVVPKAQSVIKICMFEESVGVVIVTKN